ncbi:hypothetical protein ATB93_16265 [Sphingomonas sp. WG]|nr:hypothetical protein ATB93_16265 [Sphingomonas sp. WG]
MTTINVTASDKNTHAALLSPRDIEAMAAITARMMTDRIILKVGVWNISLLRFIGPDKFLER